MLYILPPPRAANPPSPWNSILCSDGENRTWGNNHKRLPRVRLRESHFQKKENESASGHQDETDVARGGKSLSECYFAGKGAALVLPAAEAQKSNRRQEGQGNNIQKHLQSMFYLLRPEETLKMAVKLESVHPSRTRYLVVVSRMGRRAEESCLLGIDCNERTTVGLVLRVLADTTITLDGDGGFSVSVCGRHHIFKPVSVQAMWSALQTLHKVSSKARTENYFQGGMTHGWVNYYEDRIESDRSCLNEWHAMDNLESRRPPSPDSVRTKPRERDETERVIRSTLKEIMMSVDLDEVTSKYIRSRLEEELDMDLGEYKPFIDQEMLTILGQMDAPTEIFDHVYLGSEWNASNYEELQKNGVGHILNVTREIDNFFPGTFDYLNVRVYDDEKTDLLKHWDDTYKYINRARQEGSKVLVHCKMGVSRSASVVIAYAMKAYNWDFKTALQHVREKRSCIKPNTSFLSQLETYQGILDAMKNKEKLQRSKSETNLKSPGAVAKNERVLAGSEPTPLVQALENCKALQNSMSGQDLRQLGARPKSWSPDNTDTANIDDSKTSPLSVSLENLNKSEALLRQKSAKKSVNVKEHVLLPCDNGESYSVSPNRIVHLPSEQSSSVVKERVNELEAKKTDKRKLVLNLPTQFENSSDENGSCANGEVVKHSPPILRAVLVKNEIWDPGEIDNTVTECNGTSDVCDEKDSNDVCNSEEATVWTASTVVQQTNSAVSSSCSKVPEQCTVRRKDGDPFSNHLDRVFDKEERKQRRLSAVPTELSNSEEIPRDCPSRQSSWSSYDSAVVLSETREAPSRHSSWGSGDNRVLPSRNSSWGSYDMRPGAPIHYFNDKGEKVTLDSSSSGIFQYDREDTPFYIGTVRRTKQKLEEGGAKKAENDWHSDCPNEILSKNEKNVEAFNTALVKCGSDEKPTLLQNLNDDAVSSARLSVSAPESSAMDLITRDCSLSRSTSNVSNLCDSSSVVSTAQCSSVKQHKDFLESLSKEITKSKKLDDPDETSVPGIVRNLKKEFEAKTVGENMVKTKNRVNSLPTSPISIHQPKEENIPTSPLSPTPSDPGEDLNLKKLIGKFESSNDKNQVVLRPKPFATQNKNARYSCIEVPSPKDSRLISNFAKEKDDYKRPPKPPPVRNPEPKDIVNTVIAKAAKKQQQFGKSHPLARLNIKPRHTNPVYNTM